MKAELGPLFAWGDNFDLKVFSPNDRKETHVMVLQFRQHPAGIVEYGNAKPDMNSIIIPHWKKISSS